MDEVVQLLDAFGLPSVDTFRPGASLPEAAVRRLNAQREIVRSIVSTRPLRQVLDQVAVFIEGEIGACIAAILLYDADGLGLSLAAAPSLPARFRPAVERQIIGQRPMTDTEQQVVATSSVALDPRWSQWREGALAVGLAESWARPFIGAQEHLHGWLALYFSTARFPSIDELQVLADAAQLAALAVQHSAGRDSSPVLSRTNSLTGLPNRVVLLERLRMAQLRVNRSHGYFAVIQLAIDGIVQLNETLGPAVGDEVLRLAAQRLLDVAGTSATVAHIWGVEFAILAEDLHSSEDATAVAARLSEAFREPFDVDGLAVSVGVTLGVAAYSNQTATDAMPEEEPLRAAGAAKEKAKIGGSGLIGIYDPATGADAVTLAPELRRGIDEHQLSMAYQPIVELASNTVHRYEALLRWSNPQRGAVPPETFVPVAEQTGLVADLGRYALREALAELARLRVDDPGMGVSVNVSVRQLADEKLPLLLAELTEEHQLPAGSVTLEVTEGVLLSGGAAGWRVLAGLRELGARIALDDFGTGFSQLSYLRQFWWDEIKIDRSFVSSMMRDVAARAIIVGVIAVAGYAGSEVVAEGVERPEQRAMLMELGCTHGQGYLFGVPGPVPNPYAGPLLSLPVSQLPRLGR